MEKFSEDLVLKVTVDLSGNACYISKSGTETVELSIITKGNSKDVSLLGKISYSSQDSDVFLTSVKNAVISLVDDDDKNFVRRIIFSHFNPYLSGEDEEGLYDAEILAYEAMSSYRYHCRLK